MSKTRVYFYLQKLKDRTMDIMKKNNRSLSYQNTNNTILITENKKVLLPLHVKTLQMQSKTCNNCKFYVDKDNYNSNDFYIYDGIGLCYKNHGLLGIKNGVFASVVRLDDKLCGKDGKWFEKRD